MRLGSTASGARDRDPLALAAAELVREARNGVAGKAHQLEQLLHPLAPLAPRHQVVDLERLADELADCVARVERRYRVLENDLHVPAQRRQVVGRELGEILALEADRAGGRPVEIEDGPPGGRLPAPALADQPERLAAGK